jgi:hypothetical protein
MRKARVFVLLGAFALGIGALLPWATASSVLVTVTKRGYEGDGIITGIAGLILLIIALAYAGKPGKRYSIWVILIAIAAIIVLALDCLAINGMKVGGVMLVMGEGLILSIVGALLAVIGGCITVPGAE